MLQSHVEQIRSNIANDILLFLSILAVPAAGIGFLRLNDLGDIQFFYIACIGITFLWAITLFKGKIPYRIKAILLVSSFSLFPCFAIMNFGLAAGAITLLALAVVLAYLFFGLKTSLLLTFLNMLSILSVGYFTDWGRQSTVDLQSYQFLSSAWHSYAAAIGLVCCLLISIQRIIITDITKLTNDLNESNLALKTREAHLEEMVSDRTEALKQQKDEAISLAAKLQKAMVAVEELAITDELTGLYNRRVLTEFVERKIRSAEREHVSIALCILDVDHFKKFNDCYGHQKGDDALRIVGSVLKDAARRPNDFAIRIGGEEFCLFLYGAELSDVKRIAQDIINRIEKHKIPHCNNSVSSWLTASLGAVFVDGQNTQPLEYLYKYADEALYDAKGNGRNCLKLISPDPKLKTT
ncbi:MAG: diguanylate cyclase [Neptuniibacter sp.]